MVNIQVVNLMLLFPIWNEHFSIEFRTTLSSTFYKGNSYPHNEMSYNLSRNDFRTMIKTQETDNESVVEIFKNLKMNGSMLTVLLFIFPLSFL